MMLKLLHRRRDNSREGSKKNIHAHYDLGNEFYGLWLDPSMTYSSALYDGARNKPLEAAQTAKYERILDQIGAKQGDSILEIGCGWGGFAETVAKDFGASLYGITLSAEQLTTLRAKGWACPELRELGYHLVWARGGVAYGMPGETVDSLRCSEPSVGA